MFLINLPFQTAIHSFSNFLLNNNHRLSHEPGARCAALSDRMCLLPRKFPSPATGRAQTFTLQCPCDSITTRRAQQTVNTEARVYSRLGDQDRPPLGMSHSCLIVGTACTKASDSRGKVCQSCKRSKPCMCSRCRGCVQSILRKGGVMENSGLSSSTN